jgi:cell division control protein 6
MLRNPRVFDETHVPDDIKHRHGEATALATSIDATQGHKGARNVLITGPSGAGKTCTTRSLLSQIDTDSPLATAYVNCGQIGTRHGILCEVLDAIGSGIVHRQSTPRDVVIKRLGEALEETGAVIVLDEADHSDDLAVVDDCLRLPHASTCIIAHEEAAIFESVREATASRLRNAKQLTFDPYSVDELADILEERARVGLADGAVDRMQLETIADQAAGNAHEAIGALYAAAECAQQRGASTMPDDCLQDALDIARQRLRERRIEYLTDQQRALFELVSEAGSTGMADLYEAYEQRVDNPLTKRAVRSHLAKLDEYSLIESIGATSNRVYRAVDDVVEATAP